MRTRLIVTAVYIISILTFVLGYWLSAANAQPGACSPRAELLKTYKEKYGEEVIGHGMTQMGGVPAVMEILASKRENRSWTVIVTSPTGFACVLAAGLNLEVRALLPGRPA